MTKSLFFRLIVIDSGGSWLDAAAAAASDRHLLGSCWRRVAESALLWGSASFDRGRSRPIGGRLPNRSRANPGGASSAKPGATWYPNELDESGTSATTGQDQGEAGLAGLPAGRPGRAIVRSLARSLRIANPATPHSSRISYTASAAALRKCLSLERPWPVAAATLPTVAVAAPFTGFTLCVFVVLLARKRERETERKPCRPQTPTAPIPFPYPSTWPLGSTINAHHCGCCHHCRCSHLGSAFVHLRPSP